MSHNLPLLRFQGLIMLTNTIFSANIDYKGDVFDAR